MQSTESRGAIVSEADSLFRRAVSTWTAYWRDAENVIHLTHEAFPYLDVRRKTVEALSPDPAGADAHYIARLRWMADQAQLEIEAGFPIVHAHGLLGLWGAFESFVEDLVIALLAQDPSVLGEDAFARVDVPVSTLLLDGSARYRSILNEAQRKLGTELALGVGRFEHLLRLVKLDGPVPRRIRDAVYEAQHIRNVWAHRGGIADSKFVERCPSLGFEVGQRVDLDAGAFLRLQHALHMYTVVILNRARKNSGEALITAECDGYEGVLAE